MEKNSVSISFARKAVAALQRRDRAHLPVLEEVGIDPALLGDDRARIPASRFSRLWLAVARELDDEFFALDARRLKRGSFATVTRFVVAAAELREAARRAAGFFNLLLDDVQTRLSVEGGTAALVLRPAQRRDLPDPVFAQETLLIMLQGLLCWAIGRRIAVEQATFAYARPPWWREYQVMYGGELRFEAPRTALRFDARHLQAPVVRDQADVRAFLAQAPGNIILRYQDASGCAVRIRRRLRGTPPAQWPRFDTLAGELSLTESTLRRRLHGEGTRFREIKDGLRRELAIQRLQHSRDSLAAIAAALGFAEPSAFHRAFRQWTGVRPGDYRRGVRAR